MPEEPVSLYMLVQQLSNALWLKKSMQILDACGLLVLRRHAAALELEGVLLVEYGEASAFQAAAVADMIRRAIKPEALISTQRAATKIAIHGEEVSWMFPVEVENALFVRLKKALGEDWEFSFPLDFSAPTEETQAAKAYDLSAAGNV